MNPSGGFAIAFGLKPLFTLDSLHLRLRQTSRMGSMATNDLVFILRPRLHQASASTLPKLCDDACDSVLIETMESLENRL